MFEKARTRSESSFGRSFSQVLREREGGGVGRERERRGGGERERRGGRERERERVRRGR